MTTEVAAAAVGLYPTSKGFGSKLTKEVGGEVEKSGRSLGGSFGKAFGAVAAIGIGAKTVGFLKNSIGAASDLGETISKVNQIFGGAQGRVLQDWAKSAAKDLGQSQQQALDAASTFAVFGKSAGLSGQDLTGFSAKFTKLASDLSSFHNTSPEEAINAIGSALRGEAEPMRKFGVLLDDASLRNEALRLGLVKTTKEALTPQQKVLASQALIYKQTKDAQGDFARTSGSLANQQKILAARFEDTKTKVGKVLLPVALRFVTFLNKNLAPALDGAQKAFQPVGDYIAKTFAPIIQKVTGFMKENPAVVKAFAIALGVLAIAIGVVTLATAAFSLALNSTGIPLLIIGIAALVAGLVYAYQHSEKFRAVVDQVGASLKVFGAFLKDRILPVILQTAAKVRDNLQPVFVALAEFFRNSVAPVIADLVAKFREWQPTIQRVIEFVVKLYARMLVFYAAVAGKVLPILIRVGGWLLRTFVPVLATVIGWVIKVIGKVVAFGSTMSDAGRKVGDFAGKVRTKIGDVVRYFTGLPGKIKTALSGMISTLFSIGADMVRGLINGVKAFGGKLIDAITGPVTGAIDKAKSLLGIKSPSRVFRIIGVQTMEGFALGIDQKAPTVTQRIQKVAADIASTTFGSPTLAHAAGILADGSAAAGATPQAADLLAMLERIRLDVAVGMDTNTKTRWYLEGATGAETRH